jgi:hypothetical protein
LPNANVDTESVTAGAPLETPVPVIAAESGLVLAFVVKITVALNDAAETGVNVTNTLHDDPDASVGVQLFVWAKSVGFVPPSVIEVMFSVAVPLLVNVIVCEALVVATV